MTDATEEDSQHSGGTVLDLPEGAQDFPLTASFLEKYKEPSEELGRRSHFVKGLGCGSCLGAREVEQWQETGGNLRLAACLLDFSQVVGPGKVQIGSEFFQNLWPDAGNGSEFTPGMKGTLFSPRDDPCRLRRTDTGEQGEIGGLGRIGVELSQQGGRGCGASPEEGNRN